MARDEDARLDFLLMSVSDILNKVDQRRPRICGRGARPVSNTPRLTSWDGWPTSIRSASIRIGWSPTSSIATSTTRTSAWRSATSAHSIATSARATATCSASRKSSRRSTRPSRLAACSYSLQGGHNPDLPIGWYEDLFRAVKSRVSRVQASRPLAAGSHSHLAVVANPGWRGARPVDCGRSGQRAGRGRGDSGRSSQTAAALLRQGDR